MPGGNKTGPQGQGPMTGRGLGYCAGYPNPGSLNNFYGRGISGLGRIFGRGIGQGFRGGRGPNFGYYPHETSAYPDLTKKDMLNILEVQAKNLKNELENIQKRISELGPAKDNQQQKNQ
jgi:hypothetical protein